MTEEKRVATAARWEHDDFGEGHEVPYGDTFSAAELEVLAKGIVPDEMEDHWFIYMEEETLHLVRAWTGYTMYRVHLVPAENGEHRVHRAEVRAESGGEATAHGALLKFIVRRVLLGDESVGVPTLR